MIKLTAEDFDRHLKQVVDPSILDQIPPESRENALHGINKALGQQAQTERSGGYSR